MIFYIENADATQGLPIYCHNLNIRHQQFAGKEHLLLAPNKIIVQNLEVRYKQINNDDYISLTDIAKRKTSEPRKVIENWMRNWSTLEYLGLWETLSFLIYLFCKKLFRLFNFLKYSLYFYKSRASQEIAEYFFKIKC